MSVCKAHGDDSELELICYSCLVSYIFGEANLTLEEFSSVYIVVVGRCPYSIFSEDLENVVLLGFCVSTSVMLFLFNFCSYFIFFGHCIEHRNHHGVNWSMLVSCLFSNQGSLQQIFQHETQQDFKFCVCVCGVRVRVCVCVHIF